MAMDLGSKGSLKADINVTPLVDVMLVLLIIMMLIAPMLWERGAPLALPHANNAGKNSDTRVQTVVAIASSSKFYVNFVSVAAGDLAPRVHRVLEDKKDKLV